MTIQSDEVHIARRFRGPPTSGNGGYVCGLAAEWVEGPAEVRLMAPIPLEVPLHRRRDEAEVTIADADRVYALARPLDGSVELDVPTPPDETELDAGAAAYPGPGGHPIPGCFVCGTERAPGDGLCIFAGESPHRDVAVAEWRPDEELAGDDGHVAERFIWAALDCPSYFGLGEPRPLALLASMQARIDRPVMLGERLRVTGWSLGRDGRKLHAATAIHDEEGNLVALSKNLWIEIDRLPA
jgi:hypothetical protein